MGYISEVALVTTQKAYSRLMAAVACNPEATRLVVEAIENENYGGAEGNYNVLFHWDWIKWYVDNDQIRLIEDWMDKEDDDVDCYDDVEYQFVRIGESNDDAEERGNANYGLQLQRSISF
tara:strand:- start:5 stop:364 length:360 start_codon:yes stop_codon:yes gene_type:complete